MPSFDEADVSDKPAYIRALPRFDPANVDAKYRQRARSLQAVDDALKAITDALAAGGRLASTYVVFASDNGFDLGPHRISGQKSTPYEETIRMPLYVRGPGVAPGLVLPQMVGNVDLAPTFAAWAGTTMPGGIDGRSFAPLLRPGAPGPGAWRQAYPLNQLSRVGIPSWRGVRTRRYTYVEYATGREGAVRQRGRPVPAREHRQDGRPGPAREAGAADGRPRRLQGRRLPHARGCAAVAGKTVIPPRSSSQGTPCRRRGGALTPFL